MWTYLLVLVVVAVMVMLGYLGLVSTEAVFGWAEVVVGSTAT